MEEHVPTGQSNDRDEPPGEEANYDMEMLLEGLEASTDGDIYTTNMKHKECGDRDNQAHYEEKLVVDR
jgi:hypothetical protein